MDWENFRRGDGSIDLVSAWMSAEGPYSSVGETFLDRIQDLQLIQSKQTAALCIAIADTISELREVKETEV
jgi:hypothetical protein